MLVVALLAFAVGIALTAWLVADGRLRMVLPGGAGTPSAKLAGQPVRADVPTQDSDASQQARMASAMVGGVETRLALLEERMARLDQEASAASGHAGRAEGLLIAFAARRVIARGGELGFIEDQLRLRFGGAQPDAVRTVIDFSRDPLTIDELSGALDTLAPGLAEPPQADRGWGWVMNELSGLFVVRSGIAPSPTSADHVRRARLQLASGRVSEAITEVEKMPGAEKAAPWIEGARRYANVQAALDVIETAAMLEPRRLRDASAREIDEPSPLAQPAETEPAKGAVPATPAAQP